MAIVHRSGLLHRDIKPANIILRDGGEVVLIDFGSSRDAASGLTRTYTQIYSTGYAPLEQMIDLRQGPFSDIYAIGAVCYHAIGGKPVAALKRHLAVLAGQADPQPSAERIGQGRYPVTLLKAIDAALEVEPEQRPQDVDAVFAILEAGDASTPGPSIAGPSIPGPSIRGPSIRGPSIRGPSIRGAPVRDATVRMPRSRSPVPLTVSRRRRNLAIAAMACVLFLAGAAYVIPWNGIVNWKTAQEEAARREVARQEAARQEALRKAAERQEAARQDAARQDAARQDAARQEAARQEAARQETARRLEAARREAARPAPPPVAADNPAWSDAEWRQTQSALAALGYYHGPISGGPDPDTWLAIRRWQTFLGLPESDRLSNEQRDQISRDAESEAALLRVPAQSPRGIPADSVRRGTGAFQPRLRV